MSKVFPNEMQNKYKSHIAAYEAEDGVVLHMGNDWNTCQDFVFDNKEQLQQLIDELIKLKERWS